MKEKVIICPAYNTSHNELWYHWLESKLAVLGYEVEVLDFPNISSPSEDEWVETIRKACVNKKVILVGHSLGCRAILAYINQYKVKVDVVVLVACPQYWKGIIETHPPLNAYVEGMREIDFNLVRSLIKKIHLYHGTSDHILSLKDVEFLKEAFGEKAQTHISETYGHFDVEEIPELLDIFPKP